MTTQIANLLDAAKARLSVKTDSALADRIGVSGNAIFQYRKGFSLPSADVIVLLCQIVGENPMIALADLGAMKSQGEARTVYERMAAILREKAA